MDSDLQCPVCYAGFDTVSRKPIDLGCGHCFCQSCCRAHPEHFRRCPECRARASNPHPAITILRLLNSRGGAAAEPSGLDSNGASSDPAPAGGGHRPPLQGCTFPMTPLRARTGTGGGSGRASPRLSAGSTLFGGGAADTPANLLPQVLSSPSSSASWMPFIVVLCTLLYLLSPLDLVPDVVPLLGWLDDLVIVCSAVWYILHGNAARGAGGT